MNFLHDLQIIKGSSQTDSINHVTIFSPCEALFHPLVDLLMLRFYKFPISSFFFPFFFRVMK